jgi:leucyl aminopeptidase
MSSCEAAPLTVVSADPHEADCDVLVVPVLEREEPSGVWVQALGGSATSAFSTGEFTGKPYEVFVADPADSRLRIRRLMLVGAGPRGRISLEVARRVASTAGLAARQRRFSRLAIWVPEWLDAADMGQALAEGLTLAQFDGGAYKTADSDTPGRLAEVRVLRAGASQEEFVRRNERGRILGECSNIARCLVNEPSNQLTPRAFGERAGQLAAGSGLSVEVLHERRLAELGMGLLLGVARGSHEPPRLIVLRHDPPGAPAGTVLGLVGKGITFDAGGISLKSAEGMERMKDDMAGGAAVLCGMRALALLHAPVRAVGVIPAIENMPGGGALKPGDVLKSASGRTVEVLNTDAEGRLALADALWYVRQLGATHVLDVATLTGACVSALGRTTSGLFGSPAEWVDLVRGCADRAGDRSWPMPVFDDYREQLRSEIADLTNTGGQPAGAITAAVFLKEFVGEVPWVHMDIAGTRWADEARPYQPKGPTGVGVRTVADVAFTSAEWPAIR